MGESYNGARLSRGDFTMPGSEVGRIIRFGVFEIDLQSGELRRDGLKVRLQEQPFQILAMLIERPGEMVTREDLCRKLWPADTFVDFDHSLNAAVKRLRDALGESAETPIFIETLARRGYRFIGNVEVPAATSAVQPRSRRWLSVSMASAAGLSYVHLRCFFCTTTTRFDPKRVSRP